MASPSHGTPNVPFSFNGLSLAAIPHEDDLWLTGEDIGRALEYADPRVAVKKLYSRNTDELDRYSTILKLPIAYGDGPEDVGGTEKTDHAGVNLTPHGADFGPGTAPVGSTRLRPVRVFNEEGVMILTMLSSQPKAAAFRAWAVAVLKAHRHGNMVIAEPAGRGRLLETCIKETRFGNPAAIHTLVSRFGYPESIAESIYLSAGTERRAVSSSLSPLVLWFLDRFLPLLMKEVMLGGGPLMEAIRARSEAWRTWRETAPPGALFALEHETADLRRFLAELAAAEGGADDGGTSISFAWQLKAQAARLAALGWSREFVRMGLDGTRVWVLALAGV